MRLTDNLFSGWRGASVDLRKQLIISRAPTMLATHLPSGLHWKAFEQMKVMEPRDLLYRMNRKTYANFLRQLGHTPERYIYRTACNGTNVEYEMKISITSVDKTGMLGPPQDSLPGYLDALFTILSENWHSFELRSPPQRDALPSVGREGNFPSGDQLSKYIAESFTSADGTIQYFEFYCTSSYEKLGKL